jgi:CheY-like chemotaxis protein
MAIGPIIWIVEDEMSQNDLVARTFSASYTAVEIRQFIDADAVLRAFAAARPDLIILDLAIPPGRTGLSELPGLDVVQAVRAASADSFIIIRTGLQDSAVPANLLDARTQISLKAYMIALGLVGGLLMATSRLIGLRRNRASVMMICVGVAVAILAGLVLPPIWH